MLGCMSTLELAALLAGYALALARLLNAAKLLWSWLPVKLQPLLPALVTVLPLLASQLGAAETKLALSEALLLALGALTTAVRGQHPVPPPLLVLLFLAFTGMVSGCSRDRSRDIQSAIDASRAACLVYQVSRNELPKPLPEADKLCPLLLAHEAVPEPAAVVAGGATGT